MHGMKIDDKQGDQPTVSKRYAQKKIAAIEAAAQVFANKGFHGATTQDIAEAMGIKQGSLYYYFRSKEQALQEVCEYGFENHVSQMEKICSRTQAVEATLQMIVASHLSNYRQKNNAMKVHNDQRLYLPKERRVRLKELGTGYRCLLENIIASGIKSGALRTDLEPHFVAYSIIGMCNTWGAYLVRDDSLELFDTIEQCADFFLRGILN